MVLAQLDCAVPKSPVATQDESVVRGEFERVGQRDIAVLCVHSDHSSSTYMFWAGDPARREEIPGSGSAIYMLPRHDVEGAADMTKPLEADMPPVATHDAIVIGWKECCSTIFYRHDGKWFTLHGGD